MKILIAYSSATGTVAECVEILKNMLSGHEVITADLARELPSPAGYDFVAVGGHIRKNKLDKNCADYLAKKGAELPDGKWGGFICCGYLDSADEYIREEIPADLRDKAAILTCFGGEMKPKAVKGLDRIRVKMMMNYILDDGNRDGEQVNRSLPEIHIDAISRFATVIKETFGKI